MEDPAPKQASRRPLVVNHHRKRSLGNWLLPLAVILVLIVFLPKLAALLD